MRRFHHAGYQPRSSNRLFRWAEINEVANRPDNPKPIKGHAAALRQIEDRVLLCEENLLLDLFAGIPVEVVLQNDVPKDDLVPCSPLLT